MFSRQVAKSTARRLSRAWAIRSGARETHLRSIKAADFFGRFMSVIVAANDFSYHDDYAAAIDAPAIYNIVQMPCSDAIMMRQMI